MSALKRMHISPSNHEGTEPPRTLCGRRPMFGPYIFTERERQVCAVCMKADRGRHTVHYSGGRWHLARRYPILWLGTGRYNTTSANNTITWEWKAAA